MGIHGLISRTSYSTHQVSFLVLGTNNWHYSYYFIRFQLPTTNNCMICICRIISLHLVCIGNLKGGQIDYFPTNLSFLQIYLASQEQINKKSMVWLTLMSPTFGVLLFDFSHTLHIITKVAILFFALQQHRQRISNIFISQCM